ncbi:hypothetical protein ACTQ56_06695 [[Clostridium] aminophilum]|uniref:hypothetical protein n=1 Tax=[Clostridium] aminophilum TaxID=1526 RepID=UPI003F98B140
MTAQIDKQACLLEPGEQKYVIIDLQQKLFFRKDIAMTDKEKILQVMKEAGTPLNAGKVAELSGLDRKIVDKEFAAMKKTGEIVSPVRCKWEPADK